MNMWRKIWFLNTCFAIQNAFDWFAILVHLESTKFWNFFSCFLFLFKFYLRFLNTNNFIKLNMITKNFNRTSIVIFPRKGTQQNKKKNLINTSFMLAFENSMKKRIKKMTWPFFFAISLSSSSKNSLPGFVGFYKVLGHLKCSPCSGDNPRKWMKCCHKFILQVREILGNKKKFIYLFIWRHHRQTPSAAILIFIDALLAAWKTLQ